MVSANRDLLRSNSIRSAVWAMGLAELLEDLPEDRRGREHHRVVALSELVSEEVGAIAYQRLLELANGDDTDKQTSASYLIGYLGEYRS